MTHYVDTHVGQKLREARTLRRMSQTDVGRKLSLSFQQIQKYEIGANRVAASRLFELAQILKVSPSYFFEGLDDPSEDLDTGLDIVNALAAIPDDETKSRIMTFIKDVSGLTVSQHA